MGRHFEVRAASMAATAKAKSAIYMRASKEIYVAAKGGTPDPNSNLALRAAIDKYRKTCPKDVIERAIKKAQGGDVTNYIEGRYEAFGPGNSYLIIDTLSDNNNRAFSTVRSSITKKGGHLGSVVYNFEQCGLLVFNYQGSQEELEEALILGEVDLREIDSEDGVFEVVVSPDDLEKAKDVLKTINVDNYDICEIRMLANDRINLEGEDKQKFEELLRDLEDNEDVQNIYHNVNL